MDGKESLSALRGRFLSLGGWPTLVNAIWGHVGHVNILVTILGTK